MKTMTLSGHVFRIGSKIDVFTAKRYETKQEWHPGTVRCIHDKGYGEYIMCVEFDGDTRDLRGIGCGSTWRIGNNAYKYPVRPGTPSSPLLSVLRKQTSINV